MRPTRRCSDRSVHRCRSRRPTQAPRNAASVAATTRFAPPCARRRPSGPLRLSSPYTARRTTSTIQAQATPVPTKASGTETALGQEGGAERPLVPRQTAEEAREQAAEPEETAFETEGSEGREEFDEGEEGDQQAQYETQGLHRAGPAGDPVGRERGQAGEPQEQPSAAARRRCRRGTEAEHDALLRLPPHEAELEEIVGQVDDGRGRDRHREGEEEREHREQQRAEAEAGEEGEERGRTGDGTDHEGGHPLPPPRSPQPMGA